MLRRSIRARAASDVTSVESFESLGSINTEYEAELLAAAALAEPWTIRWATNTEVVEIRKRTKDATKIGLKYKYRKKVKLLYPVISSR